MNFHSNKWINEQVNLHFEESRKYFNNNSIIGIFLQGSQNYDLDYEGSDIDTKLIVAPTFKDIAMNKNPVSTTHVRENNEHIDWKDIRLYIQTFRKQNLNFVEILFTPYKILNPMYSEQWIRLVKERESIARYSPINAVKSMRGIAKEKYFALEHKYPSRMEWINKFGYDPKQLHHLLRIQEYLERYINGESYENCLKSENAEFLTNVKLGIEFTLEEAKVEANRAIKSIDDMCEKFLQYDWPVNTDIEALFDDVQYNIMKIAVEKELLDD